MRIVSCDIEEILQLRNALNFGEWEDVVVRLDRLGYIKEVHVEDDYEAITFAHIYLAWRRRHHHKGLTLITSKSPQWSLLKAVAQEAMEYCDEFDLDLRGGFATYLDYALELGLVTLRDLRFGSKKIIDTRLVEDKVDNDPNQIITDKLVQAYTEEVMRRSGYADGVKVAKDYLPFIAAAELCVKYALGPKEYISYLAEKWEWTGVIKPHQLHGKGAEEYLRDMSAEKGPRPTKVKKVRLKKGADRFGD